MMNYCFKLKPNLTSPTIRQIFLVSSCSREQCKLPEAVLAFTLMDYDVITKNDFGGEAFMSLSTVPGEREMFSF